MENKKKYYFLVNSLEWGWAEGVILRIASELQKENEIHIITLKDEKFYDIPEGVLWKPLSNVKSNMLMFLMIPYYAIQLLKVFKKEHYDAGISFLEISNFVHILAKKNPIISVRISLDFFRGFFGNIYLFLIKVLYPRAGKIIVNSSENGEDLRETLSLPKEKIITIHNPIDLEKIEKQKREEAYLPGYKKEYKKYITVGRLVWQKHHEDIIMALADMKKWWKSDFLYYIIGDWEEKEKLKSLIEKYELTEHIYLLGAQKNVFAYLARCDVFLYASEAEGFPNVLLEAVGIGLPIITTDFKTWAREVIYWEYKKGIALPSIGPNGALLRPRKFREDFIAISGEMGKVKQEQQGLEWYRLSVIAREFLEALQHQ